ncbi:Hypothetical protein CINCED_3A019272 [Cinara cedri]|nr:Hypothetical protein CINCED_3A019272 [Cinara cedri]
MKEIENTEKSAQEESSNDNEVPKKSYKINVKGKRRKKCLRDKAAPRPPLSGYIRFLNDRRDQFRSENPNMSFAEVTKVLATEWNQLPADKKQQYLSAAEQEREKYVKELEAYKKTDAHRNFVQRKLKKKKVHTAEKENPELEKEKPPSDDGKTVFDIPIFSEEFLNFNKARESELRYLRKTVTDQEQEVSILDKHIENLNVGINKLTDNTEIAKYTYEIDKEHLNYLRSKFLEALAHTSLPGN